MALVHAKTTAITNLDASPVLRGSAGIDGPGVTSVQEATVLIAGQADIHSTYQLFRVRSDVSLKSIEIFAPDTGTTGKFDIGAYYGPNAPSAKYVTPPTYNGVSLIDVDFFAQALTVSGTGGGYARILPGCGVTILATSAALLAGGGGWTVAKANMPLWKALGIGLTAEDGTTNALDPKVDIEITIQLNEAVDTGAVTIFARIEYTTP